MEIWAIHQWFGLALALTGVTSIGFGLWDGARIAVPVEQQKPTPQAPAVNPWAGIPALTRSPPLPLVEPTDAARILLGEFGIPSEVIDDLLQQALLHSYPMEAETLSREASFVAAILGMAGSINLGSTANPKNKESLERAIQAALGAQAGVQLIWPVPDELYDEVIHRAFPAAKADSRRVIKRMTRCGFRAEGVCVRAWVEVA